MDSNHRYPEDKLPLETDFCPLHHGSRSRKTSTSFRDDGRRPVQPYDRTIESRERAWAG